MQESREMDFAPQWHPANQTYRIESVSQKSTGNEIANLFNVSGAVLFFGVLPLHMSQKMFLDVLRFSMDRPLFRNP